MVIIGLIGTPCSGKTSFCAILKEKFNYKVVDLKQESLDIKQLQSNVLNCWSIPTIVLNIVTLEQIRALSKRHYFHLIFIDAPIYIRYLRFKKKYIQTHPTINFKQFAQMDDEDKFTKDGRIDCMNECKVFIQNDLPTLLGLEELILHQKQKIDRPFRPNWDVYFMKIAYTLKQKSNCMKKSAGAVLVDKYKRIISTSYNGTPKVMPNCNEGGCTVCNQDTSLNLTLYKCMCIHAEEGCILEAGVTQSRGNSIYTTLFPCVWCCKALVQAGVEWIYYDEQGDWELSLNFLEDLIRIKQVKVSDYIF